MSIVVYTMAAPLLDTFAPGLVWDAADGVLTRQIAIVQLKVMAPCVMLAALIGISFGSLSADGIYGVPSLSPALSSMAILVAVAQHVLWFGSSASASENFMAGGIVLAVGSTLGAVLQWLAQGYRSLQKTRQALVYCTFVGLIPFRMRVCVRSANQPLDHQCV
jgi:putative peptidoglycan lipid II flippase